MSWATAAVSGAVAWAAYNQYQRIVWKRVCSDTGLELVKPPLPPRLRGRLRGFEVAVSGLKPRVSIEVLGVDAGFTLAADSPMARSISPDLETGDPEFDDFVRVEGDRDYALALLHFQTRRAAEKVVYDHSGRVEGGRIKVSVDSIRTVPRLLEPVLDLAELLRRPPVQELPQLLSRSARTDPSPGYRRQAFRHLAKEFYGAPDVLPTARVLLEEPLPELRFEAARSLLDAGETEDRERAEDELVDLASRRNLKVLLRCRALEQLVRSGRSDVAVRVAAGQLADRGEDPEIRRAAIVTLGHAKAMEELLALVPASGEKDLEAEEAEVLATALGQCSDVRAQPRLLGLLEAPDDGVRIAAANALASAGDARAVPALRHAAESPSQRESPFARAAEDAILQIQQRLGGRQAGEISITVTEGLEGAVSPAEDSGRGGEVSLTDGASAPPAESAADD